MNSLVKFSLKILFFAITLKKSNSKSTLILALYLGPKSAIEPFKLFSKDLSVKYLFFCILSSFLFSVFIISVSNFWRSEKNTTVRPS